MDLKQLLKEKYSVDLDTKIEETIVKFTKVDAKRISKLIVEALSNSEEFFTSVKINDNGTSIKVEDSEGVEYDIYINTCL